MLQNVSEVDPALCESCLRLPLVLDWCCWRRPEYFIESLLHAGDQHWVWHYQILEDLVVERYMLSLHWSLTQFTPAGDLSKTCLRLAWPFRDRSSPAECLREGVQCRLMGFRSIFCKVFLILIAMVGFSSFVSAWTLLMLSWFSFKVRSPLQ